ncbi:MAG: phospho-sugar mutase [Actinomycetota bacterium]|nr:phospho-sugar mutase [Actinomycetota bacterium]MDH5278075.1 phospho-sugar mutase [Actinomycetota bacterium]
MTSVPGELTTRVRSWLADDPDPRTRDELAQLVESAQSDQTAAADLADRFSGTLQFGTAGLRGAMGAGPMRMNRATVGRAAAGLAAWLTDHGGRSVVIGYDARTDSDVFARDTAQIMSGAGLAAMVLPHPLPTPVLAFAIRHLGAAAGVMVTASHNPAADNGYKVYLGDGSQIVPPTDAGIASQIAAVGRLADVARGDDWTVLDDAVLEAYLDRAASLVPPDASRDLVVVTTAMHGVGGSPLAAALRRAGFPEPLPVAEQAAPDPAFPTVAFPNPEEPGALDLALTLAAGTGADVVLAVDPDADRCAVAVPTGATGWRPLTGDELGGLLGEFLASRGVAGTFATTIVSSSRLSRIAAAHGQPFAQTLTGFKWIGRVPDLAFGYEEAIGYCVDPSAVADKDGISACLRVAELAARLKADGRGLLDALDDLDRRYGVHQTSQISVRSSDREALGAVVSRLRDHPPGEVGGLVVTRVEDLATGVDGLPSTEGLRLSLAGPVEDGSARLIVRPSGTEPKLKAYLEVVVPVDAADLAAARATAGAAMGALRTDVSALLGASTA